MRNILKDLALSSVIALGFAVAITAAIYFGVISRLGPIVQPLDYR